MKQLIFILTLLPFLAAYPAAKPADANAKVAGPESEHADLDLVNASACAADVKIADADLKSARDEKTQSADRKSEIHCLEQQLFPGIHYLFSQARGIERKLMKRVACLLDPKPIKDKYNDVLTVFECPRPLWGIISGYAVEIPTITQEIFSTLFPENEYSRISNLGYVTKALAAEHAFMELIRAFHDANETFDQCWPYSRAMLDSFLRQGYSYQPYNLDLTILRHSPRAEHLNRVPPWRRPFEDPNDAHQCDADSLVETLNRVEQYHSAWQEKDLKKTRDANERMGRSLMLERLGLAHGTVYVDDTVYEPPCPEEPQSVRRSHTSLQNTIELISYAYSWDKILKWFTTLPAEQQKTFADRIKSTHAYEYLNRFEAEQALD